MAFVTEDEGGNVVRILPPAPPPPVLTPPPPGPVLSGGASSSSAPAQAVNANGETLAQAEAAVLAEVAAGALGADALARHPLPPGTSSAEALRFLASLPQTTYQFGQPGGTVTGPPIDTLNPPEDPSVDLSGGGGTRELESAYKPAGVVKQWREFVDVLKVTVPAQHSKVSKLGASLLEVFK